MESTDLIEVLENVDATLARGNLILQRIAETLENLLKRFADLDASYNKARR